MSNTAELSKLKVVDLRSELSNRNLSTKGKKDELVVRLAKAIEEENKDNEQSDTLEQPDGQATEKSEMEETSENKIEENQSSEENIEQSQIEEKEDPEKTKEQEKMDEAPKEEDIQEPEKSITEETQQEAINIKSETEVKDMTSQPEQQQGTEETDEAQQEKEEVSKQTDKKPSEEVSQEKSVKQSSEAEKTEIDSNKRKRSADEIDDEKRTKMKTEEVNDAINSSALYVKGFIRPLIIRHVQELLSKYGEVKRFWMDAIKTHCYVIYKNESEAKEAFKNINGLKFPVETGKELTVGSLTNEQIEKLIELEHNAAEQRLKVDWESNIEKIKAGETLPESPTTEGHRRHRSIGIDQVAKQLAQASSEPVSQAREVRIEGSRQKQKELSLDDLFRKTKALPHLYYLPNTDEEAKIKLEKLQRLA
ncbi:uncharacterized protein BX663DRAFT_511269 [Cokeromyces recurvatus]|uniref:uncharacterized protein n=1 Tax=Cokeromyces recurvatus TaxID=90255 RepID=UPI00221F5A09|nr:uncharacterized protein BX663DRAFT_511269 [Cokeromyces recurvatus]KAI7902502.1 hypothetical protein BX663DRAFT_511269 [Cokeromyces recurvatus]